MDVSGVRSSWETLAMKSRRVFSARSIAGDVVEHGDGASAGGGGGADLEDYALGATEVALPLRGSRSLSAVSTQASTSGSRIAWTRACPCAHGYRGDTLHDGVGPADAASRIDGDDRFLHAVEEGGELPLLGFEGTEGGIKAGGCGIEGVGYFGYFVQRTLFGTGRKIAGSDPVGEGDDALEAGSSAMGEESGEQRGEGDGDERYDEQVTPQHVHGGVNSGHGRSEADDDIVFSHGNVEGVSPLALAEAMRSGDSVGDLARDVTGDRKRFGGGENGALAVEERDVGGGVGFSALGKLLKLGVIGSVGFASQQAGLAGEGLRELIAEGVFDNAPERDVEYGGADGEHQHEREEELSEDSAGHFRD